MPSSAASPTVIPAERAHLLGALLRDVSRAFYLTLRILPAGVREPVGLAYLLARAADTIADTAALPPETRLRHLLALRAQLDGGPAASLDGDLTDRQSNPAERVLLGSLPQAFAILESLPAEDARRVRDIVRTLTLGMEMDLKTFPAEDSGQVAALSTAEDLDAYIYHVAGCVGEFWTRITVAHTPALRGWSLEGMSAIGVRFGKALQLTNVLRDVPADLRIGRCYLPEEALRAAGLSPEDLLRPESAAAARPILHAWIRTALDHFAAAEAYLLMIPRRCMRLRLAVLWPILIGLATLEIAARNPDWLDPRRPAKVPRKWVYRMLAASLLCVSSNTLLRAWIGRLRMQVLQALL